MLRDSEATATGTPPGPRAVRTRRRLLDAAEAEFGTHGFHHTQVAQITERADLGIGTFYRYFADKEDALRAVLQEFFERVRVDLVAVREGIETKSPVEQIDVIRQTYWLILGELTGRPLISMIMFRGGYGVSDAISQLIWDFVQAMTADVARDVERAIGAGLLEAQRVDLVADCVAGIVLQMAHKLVIAGEGRIDDAVEACTRFTLGGLAGFATESYFEAMQPVYRDLLRWNASPVGDDEGSA